MPRATTAAWEVMPPRAVRMPWAACMPPMSSGEVSVRTRMTFSPLAASASASAAVKTTLPTAAPGEAGQALGDLLHLGLGVHARVQELVELVRLHSQDGQLLVDQPLLHHVHGDLHGRGRGALAHAALQHVELAVLDRELDVQHVRVVLLQPLVDPLQLGVHLGHGLLELADGLGRADARHHVLALGVHQVLAEEPPLAGARVPGEGHARPRVVAHVAEDHGLDVDRRPPVPRDVVQLPVGDGPRSCPRTRTRR